MKLTNDERETIFNFNEGEATASIYTHSKPLRRRLEKLAAERPEDCRLYKLSHDGLAAEYYLPKSWIKVSPPRKGTPLTDAQRQQRREQLARARKG